MCADITTIAKQIDFKYHSTKSGTSRIHQHGIVKKYGRKYYDA